MECRERESHARGVYPTLYTSRTGTARVKEEVGADTRIIVIEESSMKYGRKERGHYKGEKFKQVRTNAKDLPMELPESR